MYPMLRGLPTDHFAQGGRKWGRCASHDGRVFAAPASAPCLLVINVLAEELACVPDVPGEHYIANQIRQYTPP